MCGYKIYKIISDLFLGEYESEPWMWRISDDDNVEFEKRRRLFIEFVWERKKLKHDVGDAHGYVNWKRNMRKNYNMWLLGCLVLEMCTCTITDYMSIYI